MKYVKVWVKAEVVYCVAWWTPCFWHHGFSNVADECATKRIWKYL